MNGFSIIILFMNMRSKQSYFLDQLEFIFMYLQHSKSFINYNEHLRLYSSQV